MNRLPKPLRFHRSSLRGWLILAAVVFARPLPGFFAAGCVLVAAGALLRLWSKGYLRQDEELTVSGPYAFSRNPFYLGNLVLNLGLCLTIGRIEVAAPYAVLWAFFHVRAMRKEERELEARYDQAFLDYKRAVPLLVPWRFWLPYAGRARGRGFSWLNPNIAERKELPRFLLALSYPFLLSSITEFRAEGIAFFEDFHALDLCAACAFLYLVLFARSLARILRRRKRVLPVALSDSTGRLALTVGFFAFLYVVRFPELEAPTVIFPARTAVALALLILTPLVVSRNGMSRVLVLELLVCAVVSVLCEMPWALFLPLLFYSIVIAETIVLGPAHSASAERDPAESRNAMLVWARVGGLLLLGFCIALLKKIVTDGGVPPLLPGV